MANAFSKEERVAFEDILEGFNDALVLSRNVSKYSTDQAMMERSNDTLWRPMPYVAQSFGGTDQTANFKESTQLSVPASINISRSSPWVMTATELRDKLQENRLGDAAKQKLASDINESIMATAANEGTLVVKRTAAASGFSDVAECEAIMNEQGVQQFDRYLALSTRDYNNMANGLVTASNDLGGKPVAAYERAFIGMVSSFETYKLDYANSLTAAAGSSITIDTQASASNYLVPKATTSSSGRTSNFDNRYQQITVSSTTNVAAGDAFTIAGVNAVHHVTKGDTGQLKTFRVISVDSSTQLTISPGIISNQGGSDAEAQYQNCVVTPSATANIVFLNTDTASVNPFWQRDALEILPGRYEVPADAGAAVMRGNTDQGFELVWQKFYDINTMKIKYRLDVLYGVVNKQPEMTGIMLFGQSS